jgi:predicted unusual protein kinase regulating ubiquinone biosynthesis (AarF/ABC1/UbiB family)
LKLLFCGFDSNRILNKFLWNKGNILLCRNADGSPQLGLIDYGQVKQLSKKLRQLFCKIIIALDDDNKDEIFTLMREAGFNSKRMDPEVIYLYAKVGYDQDNDELTKGVHIQMFMEDLEARDPIISLPRDFISVARASLMLRGLAHSLNQSRSVAAIWRPIAERVLREDI